MAFIGLTRRRQLVELRRPRVGAGGALHGGARRQHIQPGDPRGLPAAPHRGQAGQGGAHRLHAEAAHHPQCHRAERETVAAGECPREHLIFKTVANDRRISSKPSFYRPHKSTFLCLASMSFAPERSPSPPRPVGCMRGSGGAAGDPYSHRAAEALEPPHRVTSSQCPIHALGIGAAGRPSSHTIPAIHQRRPSKYNWK